MAERTLMDTNQMARLIDVTARHVRKLTVDGVLNRARNEMGDEIQGRYELVPNNHSYIHFLRKQGKLDEFSDAKRHMLGNRKMAADAEMAELRLLELKGNVHRSDDVEFLWTNKLTRIKARIQAIPSRTARQLVGKTDYREIHDILTDEVEQVLRECSGYSSAEFKDSAEIYLEEQGAGLIDLAAAKGTNGNGSDDGEGEENISE
jgi:phage terminase Nu1 subunit (DNA packaging protein)